MSTNNLSRPSFNRSDSDLESNQPKVIKKVAIKTDQMQNNLRRIWASRIISKYSRLFNYILWQ